MCDKYCYSRDTRRSWKCYAGLVNLFYGKSYNFDKKREQRNLAMKFTKLVVLFCIASQSLVLSGCDTFADFVKKFSEVTVAEKSGPDTQSYEKAHLLDMLDKQRRLIEEMQHASNNGDNSSIKALYEEFLRLDQSYQQEFEKYEEALSNKDGLDISKSHLQIIRILPKYSSLMQ
jgi:hypothetical protein